MASPQKEDGYTVIANEIADKFCQYRISGEEWLVLWTIIRKTYGWNKKNDRIALSQFAVTTGLKRQTVLRAINKLSSKKIIDVIKNDDSHINLYSLNKNFDEWIELSKKITLSSKKIIGVIKKDNQLSSKKSPTKETITKETITKDNSKFFLPELIKKETWEAYLEMRKVIKKPATLHAQKLIIKKLLSIGGDLNAILENSILNSYQGVFAPKTEGTSNGNTKQFNTYKSNVRQEPALSRDTEAILAEANRRWEEQNAANGNSAKVS